MPLVHRRPIPGRVLVSAVTAFALAWSAVAEAKPPAGPAGPKDKAALKLDDEALSKDYLETNFAGAAKKLQQAISTCGSSGCSAGVLARLHRDLAVVDIGGLNKADDGKTELKAAIDLDPSLELDPDYATPDIKKAFDEVRGGKPATDAPKPRKPAGPPKKLSHTPVTEQLVAAPVPVFAEWGGDAGVKIKLWYRGVGDDQWNSVDMTPNASGLGAEVPCAAAAKRGELAYYVEVRGEDKEVLESDGSRDDPHTVAIVKELTGPAPHMPDTPAPGVCKDVCSGDDCGGGEKRPRKNWITVTVQQDFALVGSGTGVCTGIVQSGGAYSCFRSDGSQYLGNPIADPGDNVNGGGAPATTRLFVGYDRVLVAGLTLGVRIGGVVHGLGPRAPYTGNHSPMYLHFEARAAYTFGTDVWSTKGFRPSLFFAGGVAQVDAKFSEIVHENMAMPSPLQVNPPAQQLDAYRVMGQGFVGGGLGAMYAFTPWVGLFVELKYMHLLPTSGNALSPALGLGFGF